MSKNYAIIRHVKVKGADQFNLLDAHNTRTIVSSNIDTERSHKNIVLKLSPYSNFDDFVFTKRKQIKEHNKKNGTKHRFVQKREDKITKKKEYSAMSQEFIFTHSHNAMNEMDSIEFLKDADRFIREWFKHCEIVSSLIHLDEDTPHIHIHATYYDSVRNKFIQKELSQKGKTDINKIREAFQQEVADKYGLLKQDGSVVQDHDYKADKEKALLKKQLTEYEHTIDIQTYIIKYELEPKVARARSERNKSKEQTTQIAQKYDLLHSEWQELKQELDELKKDLLTIHGKGWRTVIEVKSESSREKQQNIQNNNGSIRPST